MARPKKGNVEYFPHDVDASSKKTIHILESRWGNDGYAFWFKLLEILGNRDGLHWDCNDYSELAFLTAKTRTSEETAVQILDCLASLGAICPILWKVRVIYSESLVLRVKDAFRRRADKLPTKEKLLLEFGLVKGVIDGKNPDEETKETEEIGKGKGKEEREIESKPAPAPAPEDVLPHDAEKEESPASFERIRPGGTVALFFRVFQKQPNGFEQPILAEMEQRHPRDKLEHAFKEAGENGASSLKYVQAILEGNHDSASRGYRGPKAAGAKTGGAKETLADRIGNADYSHGRKVCHYDDD